MNNRKLFKEIIVNIMACIITACPCAALLRVLTNIPALYCLLLFPVFLLLYCLRLTIKWFWLFILAHIAVLALSLLSFQLVMQPASFGFILSVLFMVIAIAYSFTRKYRGEMVPSWELFVTGSIFCVVAAFEASYFDDRALLPLAFAFEIILASGMMVFLNMNRLDDSLETLTAGHPYMDSKHILRFNNRIIAGFIALSLVIAVLMPSVNPESAMRLLRAIGLAIALAFYRMIMWLFVRETETPPVIPETPESSQSVIEQIIGTFAEPGEPSAFARWIDNAISVIVSVAIVAAVLFGVVSLIYSLYKGFASPKNSGGDIEEKADSPDKKEISRKWWVTSRDFGRGKEKKIRKLYYKTVSCQTAVVSNTDTTGDILAKLEPFTDISELTKEYEQVRYGEKTI